MRTPPLPSRVVSVVTDRNDWARQLIEACHGASLIAERWLWADVVRLREPGIALAVDVESVSDRVIAAFEEWAGRAWQPQCVVSLEPAPGVGRFASCLEGLGFERMVHVLDAAAGVRVVCVEVREVIGSDAWLAARAAEAMSCTEPVVVRSLARGLELLPQHHTVKRWAHAMGWARRQDLESLYSAHALPAPKAVLDRLRLARVVHLAGMSDPTPTRSDLAARFGYSSADYLGKRAKDLTGVPLGRLMLHGATAVIASLGELARENGAGARPTKAKAP